ncbi:FadR/GntR family transcriptional regulator [Ilumatobacter coccineus]|jgi:GntR family transcriptional regulator, transcriptional repressor for pyruvate dehydrogenase complex|uniref:Putative GntR family transcriptional regulator n=1 Tax=Ilumatobacter coccineus (strain NBRC 103263 / KCTC 29153 / YM16-304) TaxID=1313172 RepID=A0A6C7EE47_ILUCY|nr:FadR/GntR family transcriptional regulator [Ilumatobacter coccineus]BAN04543.1 putative GntR family transcriptional regulator [Ilumatobacter coccineus YM16-304]
MTQAQPFAPISRETVSSQIRAQLLERITTGELAPGARMPSERELSERFDVARTSVREAMQGLVSMGVVERRGNRSYVAEHLPDVVVEPNGDGKSFVAELFETRRVLELPLFEMAAERASDADRQRIAAIAAKFDDALDITEFRRLDREFHTTIASTCGNPLLIELYGKVLDQLFRSVEFFTLLSAESNQTEVERIIAESAEAHRHIAQSFIERDTDAVRKSVHSHLDSVEHSMVSDLD